MKAFANIYERYEEQTEPKINLVIKAYDRVAELLEEIVEAIEKKDIERKAMAIEKATNIITELMTALDFEQGKQIAVGLKSIYSFTLTELMNANLKNEAKSLKRLANIFKDLNSAWREVAKQYYQKATPKEQGLTLNAGL